MTTTRESRAKLNIVVSLAGQIVVILCGLIVPRLLIGAFGSEAYGATASIAQFLAYITLLEGGIGFLRGCCIMVIRGLAAFNGVGFIQI